MRDGSGPDNYGLLVARYIVNESSFVTLANKIHESITGINKELQSTKVSAYNKDLFMDHCELCNKKLEYDKEGRTNLESHHITEQHTFDKLNKYGRNKDNLHT